MSVRLAACEPCRRSKLACGHERPTCKRCGDRGQNARCVYRVGPFRKRALKSCGTESADVTPVRTVTSLSSLRNNTVPEVAPAASPTQQRRYPNPGYLGISSHSTLFNQVSSGAEIDPVSSPHASSRIVPPVPLAVLLDDEAVMNRAVHALTRLDRMDISNITPLVRAWLAKDVNLPLAGPFVVHCLESVAQWRDVLAGDQGLAINREGSRFDSLSAIYVKTLMTNTQKTIVMWRNMTTHEYLVQMLGKSLRWETLGIFFTAAARAAYDTAYFPTLYKTNEQRRKLIKAMTYTGDCCLETCLALDCLNDLQLVLQYENFIVHSEVDGDQSYHSWRRMGDVTSSLFAMGYHERLDEPASETPPFIIELRKACFARIYAADKSLAVFLGRPPRIVKDYCHFTVPSKSWDVWEINHNVANREMNLISGSGTEHDTTGESITVIEPIDYIADTRCSALFAYLKEEVLQLLRKRDTSNAAGGLSELRARVDKQWDDLPSHFRLTNSLKDCQRSPFERDFLAGTRLDYLHIKFLLGLVSQQRVFEPDDYLLPVAIEMLSITVEIIILRDQLVNSGSCLIWKVAQYGLPAAGIISLALLNSSTVDVMVHSRSQMIQALSVLVAEVATGTWIQAGEPNFALFTRATRTIQSLLDSLLAARPPEALQDLGQNLVEGWEPYANTQLWEFETDFWANLAEHPILQN